MTPILITASVAALGILAAFAALAIPKSDSSPATGNTWDAAWTGRIGATTLRDRFNQPFRALAERSNRHRRLNGGLTLAENLARADLKLRSSEFVLIQVGFLVVYAEIGRASCRERGEV